jgi:DNA modification methylase
MIDVGHVGMIDISKIIVGEDRVREVMGDLEGVRASMKESGLITPLSVQSMPDGNFLLLGGERRYTILLVEGNPLVPARIYERVLTPLEIKVIEKSENFYRKDFEYWELDKLVLEIHNMQQELQGAKAPGPGSDGWGTRDTADMVGFKSAGDVSQAIKRAEAREAYPDLFENCKSASDASKVISKVSEAAVKQQIAAKLESTSTDVTLKQLSNSFIIKDFFEGIKDVPDGIFNMIEIDPPYAIKLIDQKKKDGESQYVLENYNEMTPEEYVVLMPKLFKECYRVMADNSWLICWFAPQPWMEQMYNWITASGLGTTRMCGVWTKGSPGQSMNPSRRLSNAYEMFFYCWKGSPTLNKAGHGNDFHYSPVPPQQKTHPTERPLELTKDLYETFAFPGSRILIPFLGSGNGLLAATTLGINAMGFELSKGYKDSFLVKAHNMFAKESAIA